MPFQDFRIKGKTKFSYLYIDLPIELPSRRELNKRDFGRSGFETLVVCKISIETYFCTQYGIHSRRSQVFDVLVKFVSHLEDVFSSRSRQRTLLFSYKIYANNITTSL